MRKQNGISTSPEKKKTKLIRVIILSYNRRQQSNATENQSNHSTDEYYYKYVFLSVE